ncbi:hypothetical protein H5410_056433 [Solanum commersonii]|uniref:Uncharacterized protein n=1 Tax=Solanum commersonii TaxID=4109 RepID=A0A9J5WK96_SOLCO|nr:hypothetical protein H5410_056433 [Solanum commersonii]
MDYSTRKSAKRGVYPLQSSFDPENEPGCPARPTDCIIKVLTEFHEKFWQKRCQKSGSPKDS